MIARLGLKNWHAKKDMVELPLLVTVTDPSPILSNLSVIMRSGL